MAVIESTLKHKQKKKERYLCEVPTNELRKAIVKMLEGLNVKVGSIVGWYDVYQVTFEERDKARAKCQLKHKHP